MKTLSSQAHEAQAKDAPIGALIETLFRHRTASAWDNARGHNSCREIPGSVRCEGGLMMTPWSRRPLMATLGSSMGKTSRRVVRVTLTSNGAKGRSTRPA